MRELDATRLVGVLVAATQGWDDATTALYTDELMRLDDRDAAENVVMRLVRSWTRPGRPPLGQIMADYRIEVDRRRLQRPALTTPERWTPLERGLQIAWDAYAEACRAEGREPDRRSFGSLAEKLPRSC